MSIGKKIGYGLLAFVPFFGMLVLQIGITVLVEIVVALWMMQQDGGTNLLLYIMQAGNFILEHYMETIMLTQIATLIVFGLWYYLAFVRKKEGAELKSVFCVKNVAGFLLIGLAVYFLINLYLEAIGWLLPDVMAEYNELMELSGIAELTLVSTIASMVLAPLGEETVFRGLTYRYFRKAGAGFLAANVLQALLFGIMHLNWVQGGYAFLLGLLLGYMTKRYNSLLVPMLLHMIFNFCGTYIATAFESLPNSWIVNPVLFVLAVCLGMAALKLLGKEKVQASVTDACGTSALSTECTDTAAWQSDRESEWQ